MSNVFSWPLVSFLILCPFFLIAQKKQSPLPPLLEEASGLYYTPSYQWYINDSGDQAKLYATDQKGNLVKTISLPTVNKDWEDLTADDQGLIYIGDFGNNRNQRKDLKIYIFDPKRDQLDSILFSYPDQSLFPPPRNRQNFDMEGFFWHQDSLHLFSKNKIPQGSFHTKHYVLSAKPGTQVALLRDSLNLKNRVVTAAAISPDQQRIALLAYTYKWIWKLIPYSATTVFVIRDYKNNHFLKGKVKRKKISHFRPAQFESIDWIDENHMLLASEKTKYRQQGTKRIRWKKFKSKKKMNTL